MRFQFRLVAALWIASLVVVGAFGASSDLRDAILVNPYDIDDMADAIRAAVAMPAEERQARLHQQVREHNIYRWEGRPVSYFSCSSS